MPHMLELTVAAGPDQGRSFRLLRDGAVIGRHDSADVSLADAMVSRRHVVLHRKGDDYEAENVSGSGTRYNGSALSRHRLKDGDRLELGGTTLQVRYVTQTGAVISHMDIEGGSSDGVAAGSLGAFDEGQSAAAPPTRAKSKSLFRKPKVLIGLAIYFGGIVALFVLLESHGRSVTRPAELSQSAIGQMMDAYFDAGSPAFVRNVDDRKARERLVVAREAAATAPVSARSLWAAAHGYRESMAYSRSHALQDPEDSRRYREARQELSRLLKNRYVEALGLLNRGLLHEARDKFASMSDIVPDTGNAVRQNAGRWIQYINSRM